VTTSLGEAETTAVPADAGDRVSRWGYDVTGDRARIHELLDAAVQPRPIAWVLTRSVGGVDNLAPHSYFTISSLMPPIVQFTSVGSKDTLRNVLATGEFVVCLATESLIDQVARTGIPFPRHIGEFDEARLTREPSTRVAAPRIAESPIALECRLYDTKSFGTDTVVFGQVVHVSVDERYLRDTEIPAADVLRPLARLGGPDWGTVTITRPTV
jgi:flavin reductase (DIM6/NTAB) family NADH-FMN oxidoreductase RutF